MRKLILIVIIMVLFFASSCTENEPEVVDQFFFQNEGGSYIDYSIYSNIPESRKQTVFFEDFKDNSRGWFVGADYDYDFKVEDGYYSMAYNNPDYYYSFCTKLSLDVFAGDFEIEVGISKTGSYDESSSERAGIIWNYLDNDNGYDTYFAFERSYNNDVYIGDYNDTDYIIWKKIEGKNTTLGYSQNDIQTIRRLGNYYYFFINGDFVNRTIFSQIIYGETGVIVTGCAIKVDYFKVSRIIDSNGV